jgi:hypothetical protein
LLSVSVMEDKGFVVEFKNQLVLKSKEFSPYATQVIGVREGKLYRLQAKHVQAYFKGDSHKSSIVQY